MKKTELIEKLIKKIRASRCDWSALMNKTDKTELIGKLIKASIQRAIVESVAALIVIIAYAYYLQDAAVGSPKYYGCLVILIASGFIAGVVWSFALSLRLLRVHPATDSAFWHEAFLAQARLLRLVPLWYLAPLCTGLLLFAAPTGREGYGIFIAMLATVVVLFGGITWLNRYAAAKIEDAAQAIAA